MNITQRRWGKIRICEKTKKKLYDFSRSLLENYDLWFCNRKPKRWFDNVEKRDLTMKNPGHQKVRTRGTLPFHNLSSDLTIHRSVGLDYLYTSASFIRLSRWASISEITAHFWGWCVFCSKQRKGVINSYLQKIQNDDSLHHALAFIFENTIITFSFS